MKTAPADLMTKAPYSKQTGLTLLELLLVIAALAILVSLVFPAYSMFKRKAEDAACMANLRSLHAGFSSYLQDHAFIWPQSPFIKEGTDETSDNEEAKWYFEQLKEYGPTRETWLCPSERGKWAEVNDPDHFDSSYVPSNFDPTPNIAYRWSLQPWVIERGGFHDQGQANAIFPDGHINKRVIPGMFDKTGSGKKK